MSWFPHSAVLHFLTSVAFLTSPVWRSTLCSLFVFSRHTNPRMMQSHCPIIVLMSLFHLTIVFGFCSFVCFWFGLLLFSLLLFLFAVLVLRCFYLFGMVMAFLDCKLVLLQHGLLWPNFSLRWVMQQLMQTCCM